MVADHNGSVTEPVEQIVVARTDAVDSQRILRAYLDDVVSRYHGRPVTHDEMTAALHEFPSDDLIEPKGVLLVGRIDGVPSGCVGLRFLPDGIGEVTRLFVVRAARGRGLGMRLMEALEATSRNRGLNTLRLDTHRPRRGSPSVCPPRLPRGHPVQRWRVRRALVREDVRLTPNREHPQRPFAAMGA